MVRQCTPLFRPTGHSAYADNPTDGAGSGQNACKCSKWICVGVELLGIAAL